MKSKISLTTETFHLIKNYDGTRTETSGLVKGKLEINHETGFYEISVTMKNKRCDHESYKKAKIELVKDAQEFAEIRIKTENLNKI